MRAIPNDGFSAAVRAVLEDKTEPAAVIAHDAKLFGSAANNGQMIAEIEPKGKTAEIFANLSAAIAGRAEIKKQKKGLLDPLLSKISKRA